jgi:hypothetical protein
MMSDHVVDEVDHAALELAIELTHAEADRREQIHEMLADNPRIEVGQFASCHRQRKMLRLKPWEPPPCHIDDADETLAQPEQLDDGKHAAARLLKQMLALGVSKWHPDPVKAIAEAKKRPSAT